MSADPCVPRGEEGVRLQAHGRVLVVTIDRPRVRNAVDGATARALAAAFDRLDADPALGAAVLTGAGGGFSAVDLELQVVHIVGDQALTANTATVRTPAGTSTTVSLEVCRRRGDGCWFSVVGDPSFLAQAAARPSGVEVGLRAQ